MEPVGASMNKYPLPSLALIAFDAAKRKAAERARAEQQRQLFLELDPRYPALLDPRLMRVREDDDE